MKKIFLLAGILLAGMSFIACDEDFDDWADPQSSQQEEDAATITAAADIVPTAVIAYDNAESQIQLLREKYILNAADGAELIYTSLYLGDQTIAFSSEDGALYADKEELATAVDNYFDSKRHITRTLPLTVKASVLNPDGTAVPVDLQINTDVNEFNVDYLPAELPDIAYENAFYYIGGYNGWNLASPTPMESNGDGSFSCVIEIGESEWFCFVPQSAVDAQNWDGLFRAQANGDTSTSGFFNLNSASGYSFNSEISGKVKFTIWPQDWKYSYATYAESLYYAGDANSWTFSPLAKDGDDFVGYYYIYKADNSSTWGFKFTTDPSWDNPQYGAGEGEGTIAIDGGNCDLPSGYESGFYRLAVNTDNLTFSVTPITVISLIGSAVNGDSSWGTDFDLSFNIDKKCWEGTFDMTDGEYKFRANHDWSINWGGTTNELWRDGANLSITAGNYTFELYPQCNGQGYVNITKN